MKAPAADQLRLLDLQAVDLSIDQLAHKKRTLPEHAEIEKTAASLAELRDELAGAESVVEGLDRKIRGLENEVEQVRARAERDTQRMQSGAVGAKELERLQHEVDSLGARQSALEDDELVLMEERENADSVRSGVQDRFDAANEGLAALEVRRDAIENEIDADVAARTAEREPIAASIPEDLRALYEKLRASSGGIGAAALRARRCGGCRIELYGTALQEARAADEDEVLRCEECRRILVRTGESGL
ncbi:zinc ribbon domain-containing protein [Cryptosporangium arvum]|uniref:Zn-ribbon protein, possibly nucleic acid-binding n=1 Tax=Cryptosporangium arvum DSM 44712 TaxID=927661 RepID=A0A010ZQ70_9ACTN|nr:C4-type zinc ribbon domain-containing protein [Cryptosporangium arvum]EXG80804.1 Zn-ribbon protein, possibly nucleic acid-binding [Cryptosporangium arvum DSM 44712]